MTDQENFDYMNDDDFYKVDYSKCKDEHEQYIETNKKYEVEINNLNKNKKRIIKAKDIDSIVISRKIKHPTRVIKNKFAVDYLSKEQMETDKRELSKLVRGRLKLAVESDVDLGAMHAGEISGLITEIKSVKDIIEEMICGRLINVSLT